MAGMEQYWGKGVKSERQRRHQNSAYYFPRTGVYARSGIADGDRNALFKFVVGGQVFRGGVVFAFGVNTAVVDSVISTFAGFK